MVRVKHRLVEIAVASPVAAGPAYLPLFDRLAVADEPGETLLARPGPGGSTLSENDPLEEINRALFFLNDTLDTFIFRPIAWTYGKLIPDPVKQSVRNVVDNLKSPVIPANDIVQLELADGAMTIGRFVVNSTVGVVGLFEVAEGWRMPRHRSDLGQTLNAYDVGAGPHLMLPVLGPATTRHGIGQFVNVLFDPLSHILGPHRPGQRVDRQGRGAPRRGA